MKASWNSNDKLIQPTLKINNDQPAVVVVVVVVVVVIVMIWSISLLSFLSYHGLLEWPGCEPEYHVKIMQMPVLYFQ